MILIEFGLSGKITEVKIRKCIKQIIRINMKITERLKDIRAVNKGYSGIPDIIRLL